MARRHVYEAAEMGTRDGARRRASLDDCECTDSKGGSSRYFGEIRQIPTPANPSSRDDCWGLYLRCRVQHGISDHD